MKYYEIGFGNESLSSTEMEDESRVRGFALDGIESIYIRIWIWKSVFILDLFEGFKIGIKDEVKFKFLIGLRG